MPSIDGSAAGPWRRFTAALPMRTALGGVAAVWALGCVWSFREQWDFAAAKGFVLPWLLPLIIDGLAAAMAGVAYSASLDGRAAVFARLATALAVAASAGSNAAWAWQRSGADIGTVTLAVAVPIAANMAFEVLLSELRRQVQRRRGLPAPVAVPYPRLIRIALAPVSTFRDWRRLVLELTELRGPERPDPMPEPAPELVPEPTPEVVPEPEPEVEVGSTVVEPITPVSLDAVAPIDPRNGHAAIAPDQLLTTGSTQVRVHQIAELIRRGEDLTGESVGELLGCSARTGRRMLRRAEELVNAT